MPHFRISYTINGLDDVLKGETKEVKVGNVTFLIRENEKVGAVILESRESDSTTIEKEALYLIDNALGALCFAYNTEAVVKPDSLYIKDLTNNPNVERVRGSLTLRSGYVRENWQVTLSKIGSLPQERKEVLDLALSYYKLSQYKNPLRIQSLFSCMSVIIRNLSDNDYLPTPLLKEGIKSILVGENPNFNQGEFESSWTECYTIERDYIAHGKEARLVDIRNVNEYNKLTNIVLSWTRQVIYYYIDKFCKS